MIASTVSGRKACRTVRTERPVSSATWRATPVSCGGGRHLSPLPQQLGIAPELGVARSAYVELGGQLHTFNSWTGFPSAMISSCVLPYMHLQPSSVIR